MENENQEKHIVIGNAENRNLLCTLLDVIYDPSKKLLIRDWRDKFAKDDVIDTFEYLRTRTMKDGDMRMMLMSEEPPVVSTVVNVADGDTSGQCIDTKALFKRRKSRKLYAPKRKMLMIKDCMLANTGITIRYYAPLSTNSGRTTKTGTLTQWHMQRRPTVRYEHGGLGDLADPGPSVQTIYRGDSEMVNINPNMFYLSKDYVTITATNIQFYIHAKEFMRVEVHINAIKSITFYSQPYYIKFYLKPGFMQDLVEQSRDMPDVSEYHMRLHAKKNLKDVILLFTKNAVSPEVVDRLKKVLGKDRVHLSNNPVESIDQMRHIFCHVPRLVGYLRRDNRADWRGVFKDRILFEKEKEANKNRTTVAEPNQDENGNMCGGVTIGDDDGGASSTNFLDVEEANNPARTRLDVLKTSNLNNNIMPHDMSQLTEMFGGSDTTIQTAYIVTDKKTNESYVYTAPIPPTDLSVTNTSQMMTRRKTGVPPLGSASTASNVAASWMAANTDLALRPGGGPGLVCEPPLTNHQTGGRTVSRLLAQHQQQEGPGSASVKRTISGRSVPVRPSPSKTTVSTESAAAQGSDDGASSDCVEDVIEDTTTYRGPKPVDSIKINKKFIDQLLKGLQPVHLNTDPMLRIPQKLARIMPKIPEHGSQPPVQEATSKDEPEYKRRRMDQHIQQLHSTVPELQGRPLAPKDLTSDQLKRARFEAPATTQTPPKTPGRRGRPRKNPLPIVVETIQPDSQTLVEMSSSSVPETQQPTVIESPQTAAVPVVLINTAQQQQINTMRKTQHMQQLNNSMAQSARDAREVSKLNAASSTSLLKQVNQLLKHTQPNGANKTGPNKSTVAPLTKPPTPRRDLQYCPGYIVGSNTFDVFNYSPTADFNLKLHGSDLLCLNHGEYLNDNIINFYLNYLFFEDLTQQQRDRTHLFNVFFNTKLQGASADSCTDTPSVRHERVRTWTKKVDLFDKDYIIVPINEQKHWFLAIVCFPWMVGMVSYDNLLGGQGRDDANCSAIPRNDSEFATESRFERVARLKEKYDVEPLPCILLFDSRQGQSRVANVRIIRDYLKSEWDSKRAHKDGPLVFDKNTIRGYNPKVPQQFNSIDCGIYLVHYVEMFFKHPIKIFTKDFFENQLKGWFEKEIMMSRREHIQTLVMVKAMGPVFLEQQRQQAEAREDRKPVLVVRGDDESDSQSPTPSQPMQIARPSLTAVPSGVVTTIPSHSRKSRLVPRSTQFEDDS